MANLHVPLDENPNEVSAEVIAINSENGSASGILIIGFACALFAVCATFGAASLHPMELGLVRARFLVDVLIMAFALVWLVALRLGARVFSTAGGIRALLAIALLGTVLCPIVLGTDLWFVGVPGVSAGCVSLVFLWWSHACTVGRQSLSLILSNAVIVAAAALVAANFTPPQILPMDYLRDMAALVACILLLFMRNGKRDKLLQVSIAESRKRRRDRVYSRLGELNYFSIGVVIGADGGLWFLMEGRSAAAPDVSPVLIVGIALLCAAMVLLLSYASHRFDMERVSKDYLTAMLACGYLCMPLLQDGWFLAFYGYVVAVIFIQLFIVFLAGAELVRFEQLSPLYSFTEIAYTVGGALVGSAAMFLASQLVPSGSVLLGCGAVVLYMCFAQVQLNRVSFPEDWVDENAMGAAVPASGTGEAQGVSSLEMDDGEPGSNLEAGPDALLADADNPNDPDEKFIPAGSYLRQRLDQIAQHYGLSPRQSEILALLARGRDTFYIMEHFTISRATAKSHVYNIYRKLDIHSRQELFDLLERDDFPN